MTNEAKPAETVTINGITVKVDRSYMENFDVLELLADLEDGVASATPRLLRVVFGDEEWKRIKGEIRKANGGILPADAVSDFVTKYFNVTQAKN